MRTDVYLVRGGYATSRESARRSVLAGLVSVDGRLISRPSEDIDESVPHDVVCEPECPYVSRGGLKLAGALDAFGIDPSGCVCVDIGASSGGFTDCLLSRGAARVYAIDSGRGQLAGRLSSDQRVVRIDGFNARELTPETLDCLCDMAVMDVSFISQTLILPALCGVLKHGGIAVTLVKPQFEAGRGAVGKGGIVKDPADRKKAVLKVLSAARDCGLIPLGVMRSPLKGGDGNIEFLAHFVRPLFAGPSDAPDTASLIRGIEF